MGWLTDTCLWMFSCRRCKCNRCSKCCEKYPLSASNSLQREQLEGKGGQPLFITITERGTQSDLKEIVSVLQSPTNISSHTTGSVTPLTNSINHFSLDTPLKENPKVLIVEDNPLNQKILTRLLKKLNIIDITIAQNGQEAIDECNRTLFSIIFMDITMPIMTGDVATKKIRELSLKNKGTPIYCHSALGTIKLNEIVKSTQMNGMINKTYDLKEIETLLFELKLINTSSPTVAQSLSRPSQDFKRRSPKAF
jgi:CheY-like chemotaxis protein